MALTEFEIPLDCGHTETSRQRPPPKNGDQVWCRRCLSYSIVPGNQPQWIIKCQSCKLTRKHGPDKAWARSRAIAHIRKTGHKVTLKLERSQMSETVTLPDTPLPVPDSQYPF